MQKNLLFLFFSTIVISSCGTIQRSGTSGYRSSTNDYDTDFSRDNLDRKTMNTDETARELGYSSSRSLTDPERKNLEDRLQLQKSEKNLSSRKEKEQYYTYKPMMKSDRERLQFLDISSLEGRDRWLSSHGYLDGEKFTTETQEAIDSEDIIVGMTEKAVRQSWGDPEMVETAGNPLYGNARWKYSKHVSSPDGYLDEKKIIYFEGGKVAGWEKF
jgi:hypothetical protein